MMFTRASSYSYSCARCGSCCRNQAIQLNGYEIARLARALGISTTSFIALHTDNQGMFLRFDEQGTCPFLSAQGCRVHGDRPLLCRLYPLGRDLDPRSGELFASIPRPPACQGQESAETDLASYLDSQQASEFLRAADMYLAAVEAVLAMNKSAQPPLWQWYDVDRLLGEQKAAALATWQKLEAQMQLLRPAGAQASSDLTQQL